MQALVRFHHLAAGDTFTTKGIHPKAAEALGYSINEYKLSCLRYDLSKLRAKGWSRECRDPADINSFPRVIAFALSS